MKKVALIEVEVIDDHNFSSRPMTHETKALEITIGSHSSNVMFNVVLSLKNPMMIGLSWLILHNSPMD